MSGGIQEFEFDNLFETSQAPTGDSPSTTGDLITYEFANDTYAFKSSWADKVADIAALKLVPASVRSNGQTIKVYGVGTGGTFYQFDSASVATGDDDLIVQPTSGTGRWIKGASGGSGSGGGSGIEQVLQKAEYEKSGIFSDNLKNSICHSAIVADFLDSIKGVLLADASSSATSIAVCWNPIYINAADKNTDSSSGWATGNAQTTNLTDTVADKKIGTKSLIFDKTAGATENEIRWDNTTQSLNFSSNYNFFYWIKLSAVTGLTDAMVKIYKDSTSNFAKFVTTTQYDGTPLAIGWNLVCFDLSATPASTGGTSWTIYDLSRYVGVGLDALIGQAYVGTLIDAVMSGLGNPALLGLNGLQQTINNNATRQEIIIDISNARYDGILTLKSGQSLSAAYAGGEATAAGSFVQRQTTKTENGSTGFDAALASGTVTLTQELRLIEQLLETLSGTAVASVEVTTPQVYPITVVGGSTVNVTDPGDTHLDLLNTNVLHVFRPLEQGGKEKYVHIGDKTMTANSSYSTGVTTITIPVSGLQVRDVLAKSHLTTEISVVAQNANENFAAATLDTIPNGVVVPVNLNIDPSPSALWASYKVGGINQADAVRSIKGSSNQTLSVQGSPNFGDAGLGGARAMSPVGTSGLFLNTTDATPLQGISEKIQLELWAYYDGLNGSDRHIVNNFSSTGGGYGWQLTIDPSDNRFRFGLFNNGANYNVYSPVLAVGFHHLFLRVESSVSSAFYLDSALIGSTSAGLGTNGNVFSIGYRGFNTTLPAAGMRIFGARIWRNGITLSNQQIQNLYRNGNYVPPELSGLRYNYTVNGVSGQKASLKAQLARSTTAVNPTIRKAALLISES